MKKNLLFLSAFVCGMLLITGCSHQARKISKSSSKSSQVVKKKKRPKKPDKIKQMMNKMTLDEKIGQLYFAHSTGNFAQMKPDVKKIPFRWYYSICTRLPKQK